MPNSDILEEAEPLM